MQNLHFILQGDSRILLKSIIVFSNQKNVINWPEDLQLEFGTGLLSCLKESLVPEDLKLEIIDLSLIFLSFYSRVLHSHWLPVFQYLLAHIPLNLIKVKIIPELMLLSDFTQKQITRQVSCHIFSSLAEVLGKEFKGPLLHRVKALSQDTNPEVREEMAKAWIIIIRNIGRNCLEETIFFDILKLLEDEVESVKAQGTALFIHSLEIVSDSFFHKEIVNILRSHVYTHNSNKIEEILAENLGPLISCCRGQFKTENLTLIKKFVTKDAVARRWVAFNLPAAVKFLSLSNELKEVACLLVNDADTSVRTTLAAGFHEIICLNKSCKVLRKISTKLIEDPVTRLIILKRLDLWVEIMDPSQLLIKIIKILTQPPDWRVQCRLVQSFLACFDKFNLKEVLDHLVPLLLHKMLTACWPVKLSCTELLAFTIHHTFYIARKLDLCNIVKEKLARSSSCFDRLLFIEFALRIAQNCSKKFFLKHFYDEYLSLAFDRAHSVQIKFLKSAAEIGVNTQHEQILNAISSVEYTDITVRNASQDVLQFFRSKEFSEQTKESAAKDKAKEYFENIQDSREVKELENSKRRITEELIVKGNVDDLRRHKKVVVKPRLAESIEPKSRSTKSTAVIKQTVPVKRK